MIRRFKGLAAVGAFLLLALFQGSASAQGLGPCGLGNYWYGLPYAGFRGEQSPPYFALYPPVYYSLPVPRTYGYSPFAYPPGTMTPEIVFDGQSQEIINPYVPQNLEPQDSDPAAKPAVDRSAAKVQWLENPYVVRDKLGWND